MTRFILVPQFAVDYPELAETIEHARLPFYCCNCLRKRPTTYLAPNFGPFCKDCLDEVVPLLNPLLKPEQGDWRGARDEHRGEPGLGPDNDHQTGGGGGGVGHVPVVVTLGNGVQGTPLTSVGGGEGGRHAPVPNVGPSLAWAIMQLRALVTNDEGSGCFVSGTNVELAGHGAEMEKAERALKAFRQWAIQHYDKLTEVK